MGFYLEYTINSYYHLLASIHYVTSCFTQSQFSYMWCFITHPMPFSKRKKHLTLSVYFIVLWEIKFVSFMDHVQFIKNFLSRRFYCICHNFFSPYSCNMTICHTSCNNKEGVVLYILLFMCMCVCMWACVW